MRSAVWLWREMWGGLRRGVSSEARVVLLLGPLLLIVERHSAKPKVFRALFASWREAELFDLYSYAWWYVGATILFLAIPLVVWRLGYRRGLPDLGGRRGDPRAALPLLPAFVVMGLIVLLVGGTSAFARKYPLCDLARVRWDVLIIYELLYGVFFLGWEFFFRGWMLNGLAGSFGVAAIWIQMVPFVLMHSGKPLPEAIGSIPAGLFLGWIAWRSRSFLYGWLLHWGIAMLMDVGVAVRYHLGPTP